MPIVIAAGLAGLLLGSFANVAIYRIPRRESLVRPGSRCPSCGSPVRARDNVPVVSWLLLRGRCRSCGSLVSRRYPVVESLTAVLFTTAAVTAPRATDLILLLPVVWVLVVLTFIDLEHLLLPNRVVFPAVAAAGALGLIAAAAGPGPRVWARALACGLGSYLGFAILKIAAPRGMGYGDVKLSLLLGFVMGYFGVARVLVGYFAAFLLGAVGGLILIALRRAGLRSEVPFGPYLAAGTLVSLFWGGPIVRAWLG